MKNICNIFGFDEQYCPHFAIYFQTLINLIKNKPNFTTLKCLSFKEFWISQLVDSSLPWTKDIRLVIETILTLPIGRILFIDFSKFFQSNGF
jgi:hypothetical protein